MTTDMIMTTAMNMGIIMSMRMSTTMVIIMTTIMHMAAGMTRVNRNPLPCPDAR